MRSEEKCLGVWNHIRMFEACDKMIECVETCLRCVRMCGCVGMIEACTKSIGV